MRLIAICQPHYLPWVGYFEMIDRVDCFVFLDDVDFIKREWKNRNRIRKDQTSADTKWLSVPILRQHQRHTPICEASLSTDVDWRRQHLDAVNNVYRRAPHFDRVFPWFEAQVLATAGARTLGALNTQLIQAFCVRLGIQTTLVSASDLGTTGRKTEKLLQICERLGATDYLANNGSATYLDPADFEARGMGCRFQNYSHPVYPQLHRGDGLSWLSHLSVVDLMMNVGPEALAVLRRGAQSNREMERQSA